MSCIKPVSSHTEQIGFGRASEFIWEHLTSKYTKKYRLMEVLGTSGVGSGEGGLYYDERGRAEYLEDSAF